MSLISGYLGLSKNVNKVDETQVSEGVQNLIPELKLEMTDTELILLSKQWLKNWEPYNAQISERQTKMEDFWMGKQFSEDEKDGYVDNVVFEALETFLPIATRQKPEPMVESDNTEKGNALADKVRKMLAYTGDRVALNLQMKQVARFWALYLLGVLKVGWSTEQNDIVISAVRPQKLILDPTARIDCCEYTGYYIGEYMDAMASDLVKRFPDKVNEITEKVKGKMSSTIRYIEWNTNEYVFWSCEDIVLGKANNPHWNYDETVIVPSYDEFGNQIEKEEVVQGNNHFNSPKMSYVFLSVFNLGKAPHDATNLIEQNLHMQRLINKRLNQIDKNADASNGGLVVSGDAFTEEQALRASKTLRKGGTVWVPTGDVNAAVRRDSVPPLSPSLYESLIDYRNELRNIFGVRGSTAQGTISEQTVGGKNITRGQDADRIGGGIATYLEQFADHTYNLFTQLMYVYYDEPHSAAVIGEERAKEYITLSNSEFTSKLLVGVKEGSMIPRDPVSQRGEAVELWGQGGIDPITFFTRLEFPNPREAAKQLYLWKSDPIQLFPDLLQKQQMEQQQQMAQQQQMMMGEQQVAQEEEMMRAEQDQGREQQLAALENLASQ